MKKDKGQGTEKGKAWLKREMRPYRPFILFLTALTVAGTLLSLAFAYLTRYLVNSASEKDGKRLILFAVILLSTLLLRILVQTAVKYLSEKGRAKISVELKNKLFFRTLRADYASFEKYHSGDLLNRFDSDVTEVAADSVNIFPAVAGMIVQCVGAVAALLTLVGYSLNDTIIVYDRIRENLKAIPEGGPRPTMDQIINRSLNQTLARTILTSGTTLVTCISLYVLGGSVIHDFSLTLLLGILFGTFSSVYVASPVLRAFGSVDMYCSAQKRNDDYERPGEHGIV